LRRHVFFNPESRIVLLADVENTLSHDLKSRYGLEVVTRNKFSRTPISNQFEKQCKRNPGFWRYTTERFFWIYDWMIDQHLSKVFHLENDNMLYFELQEMLPAFEFAFPKQLGVTFDCDDRGIAGVMYVGSHKALEAMLTEWLKHRLSSFNDMDLLGLFHKRAPHLIDNLPITTTLYTKRESMVTLTGKRTANRTAYSKHIDIFQSLFDAAAFGQYIGGTHTNPQQPFINENCVFNPARFAVSWALDIRGKLVPLVSYEGETYRLNNLHIHSKELVRFQSF
jgi:hypothetical protein